MDDLTKPIRGNKEEYSDSVKDQQLQHMSSRHRAMMRYLIAGKTIGEIAEMFALTQARVSIIINSPLFRAERAKMDSEVNSVFTENEGSKIHRDEVRQLLEEEALKSLNKVIELRDGATSERVRQLSALEILDRAGYKAAEKIVGNVEIDASEGLINAIQEAVASMKNAPIKPVIIEKVENGKP